MIIYNKKGGAGRNKGEKVRQEEKKSEIKKGEKKASRKTHL